MISNKKLDIFENFIVDKNLPKHLKKDVSNVVVSGVFSGNDSGNVIVSDYKAYLNYLKENKKILNFLTNLKIYLFEKWFPDFFDLTIRKAIEVVKYMNFFNQ